LNPFWFLKRNRAKAVATPSSDDKVVALLNMPKRASEGFKLSEQGAYRESTAVVEALLADLDHAHGPAVDDVRSKLLGLVGANYFHLGELDRSRAFTVKALEECRRVRDQVGTRTYRTNLRALDNQPVSMDRRFVEVEMRLLTQLDRSQRLSDQFRCKDSNELLGGILRAREFDLTMLMDRYRGKIWGLMAENYLVLGDLDMAAQCTEAAIQHCSSYGDELGVRTYTCNLKSIRRPPATLETATSAK
jgi:hypothetical protein